MKLLSAAILALVVLPLVCIPVSAAECPDAKNINKCSSVDLTRIKGIGPKTAQKIIDGRPYTSVQSLTRVKGIGPKTMQRFVDAGYCVGGKK